MKGDLGPTVRRILRALPVAGDATVAPLEVANALGLSVGLVRSQLWRLAKLGHAARVAHGCYQLATGFRLPRRSNGPVTELVLEVIARAQRPLSPMEIAARAGHPLTAVHQVVARAAGRGLLARRDVGEYCMPRAASPQASAAEAVCR